MDERRLKNLCFWCDEKFVPGHKCKNIQVYMMEVEGVVEEEGKDVLEGCENESTNQQPELSLHALTEAMGQQTMQVVGMLGRRPMQVLIDYGSTHNFLSAGLAHKLGLLGQDMPIMSVKVANGEQLPCSKVIRNFSMKIQGYVFGTDVFLIPLENYDLILGIQWLASLGDIS
ncbi:RVP_2 domain-containing protein [Cephalotus follicularis]|uniref:RVP_2 domain-containing protein n=1 Tax=Cephalotus follicularis TaxID=3775 RepID=A0A1Q3CHV1_CEPFO|nr:RVP_2 domain-containing protein [Cephalotus follicularis]